MFLREKSTEAGVTDTSLVATFHKANPPLVWKFDLERNHSFTLTLQGEEGDWELGLTSPKGDFYPITHFLTHEDAEEAFKEVNKALARRKFSLLRFGFKMIGVLILIGILVLFFMFFLPLFSGLHKMSLTAGHGPLSMEQMPQGVPMPADAFLRPPEAGQAPAPPTAAPAATVPLGVPVPADEILKPPH